MFVILVAIMVAIAGIFAQTIQDNMILISGGSYKMGDFTGNSFANERPVHNVTLDAFYMSKYQLTVGEFRDFVEETGYISDCEKKKGGFVI